MEKTYYINAGFFNESPSYVVYSALLNMIKTLDLPMDVTLVFNKEHPMGKFVFERV